MINAVNKEGVRSGIYQIINRINGVKYIGSSWNMYRRFTQHKRELRRNGHYNTHLQRAWNKYGEKKLRF